MSITPPRKRFIKWLLLASPFVAALGLRLFILSLDRMPFESDEAIFLLMARHILKGGRPLFLYGESYGGSIDSYLTALFYHFFGESITGPRLAIQSLEYLLGMLFTYLLARRILPKSRLGNNRSVSNGSGSCRHYGSTAYPDSRQ